MADLTFIQRLSNPRKKNREPLIPSTPAYIPTCWKTGGRLEPSTKSSVILQDKLKSAGVISPIMPKMKPECNSDPYLLVDFHVHDSGLISTEKRVSSRKRAPPTNSLQMSGNLCIQTIADFDGDFGVVRRKIPIAPVKYSLSKTLPSRPPAGSQELHESINNLAPTLKKSSTNDILISTPPRIKHSHSNNNLGSLYDALKLLATKVDKFNDEVANTEGCELPSRPATGDTTGAVSVFPSPSPSDQREGSGNISQSPTRPQTSSSNFDADHGNGGRTFGFLATAKQHNTSIEEQDRDEDEEYELSQILISSPKIKKKISSPSNVRLNTTETQSSSSCSALISAIVRSAGELYPQAPTDGPTTRESVHASSPVDPTFLLDSVVALKSVVDLDHPTVVHKPGLPLRHTNLNSSMVMMTQQQQKKKNIKQDSNISDPGGDDASDFMKETLKVSNSLFNSLGGNNERSLRGSGRIGGWNPNKSKSITFCEDVNESFVGGNHDLKKLSVLKPPQIEQVEYNNANSNKYFDREEQTTFQRPPTVSSSHTESHLYGPSSYSIRPPPTPVAVKRLIPSVSHPIMPSAALLGNLSAKGIELNVNNSPSLSKYTASQAQITATDSFNKQIQKSHSTVSASTTMSSTFKSSVVVCTSLQAQKTVQESILASTSTLQPDNSNSVHPSDFSDNNTLYFNSDAPGVLTKTSVTRIDNSSNLEPYTPKNIPGYASWTTAWFNREVANRRESSSLFGLKQIGIVDLETGMLKERKLTNPDVFKRKHHRWSSDYLEKQPISTASSATAMKTSFSLTREPKVKLKLTRALQNALSKASSSSPGCSVTNIRPKAVKSQLLKAKRAQNDCVTDKGSLDILTKNGMNILVTNGNKKSVEDPILDEALMMNKAFINSEGQLDINLRDQIFVIPINVDKPKTPLETVISRRRALNMNEICEFEATANSLKSLNRQNSSPQSISAGYNNKDNLDKAQYGNGESNLSLKEILLNKDFPCKNPMAASRNMIKYLKRKACLEVETEILEKMGILIEESTSLTDLSLSANDNREVVHDNQGYYINDESANIQTSRESNKNFNEDDLDLTKPPNTSLVNQEKNIHEVGFHDYDSQILQLFEQRKIELKDIGSLIITNPSYSSENHHEQPYEEGCEEEDGNTELSKENNVSINLEDQQDEGSILFSHNSVDQKKNLKFDGNKNINSRLVNYGNSSNIKSTDKEGTQFMINKYFKSMPVSPLTQHIKIQEKQNNISTISISNDNITPQIQISPPLQNEAKSIMHQKSFSSSALPKLTSSLSQQFQNMSTQQNSFWSNQQEKSIAQIDERSELKLNVKRTALEYPKDNPEEFFLKFIQLKKQFLNPSTSESGEQEIKIIRNKKNSAIGFNSRSGLRSEQRKRNAPYPLRHSGRPVTAPCIAYALNQTEQKLEEKSNFYLQLSNKNINNDDDVANLRSKEDQENNTKPNDRIDPGSPAFSSHLQLGAIVDRLSPIKSMESINSAVIMHNGYHLSSKEHNDIINGNEFMYAGEEIFVEDRSNEMFGVTGSTKVGTKMRQNGGRIPFRRTQPLEYDEDSLKAISVSRLN